LRMRGLQELYDVCGLFSYSIFSKKPKAPVLRRLFLVSWVISEEISGFEKICLGNSLLRFLKSDSLGQKHGETCFLTQTNLFFLFSLLNRLLSSIWKNMKNHSKKCLQNENERVIMIDGLFSKGVKRSES